MKAEKYNLIQELGRKNVDLVGDARLALIGQGDFYGVNNVARSAMNIKHHTQHLTINEPEFPYLYEGKENLTGANSSFYCKTDKAYKVIGIVKKYNELLKGKSYIALYFLYCAADDSYKLVERKEVENLTENFGFNYKNDVLDQMELGEEIPKDTLLYSSTSYDENMNVSIGVNGRILYGVHPAVQDDAIIISKSFAKRMMSNQITSKVIPINENTILLNRWGRDGSYQGLPNIGDVIQDGILAATRNVKETRMFSDLRDSSLNVINQQSDTIFYGEGEVIDINVYCNNHNIKTNKVNAQLLQYHHDSLYFYTDVYNTCKDIIKNSGSKKIDKEINRWMRKSMDYLDKQAIWAFNDNIFSNLMVEILIRKPEEIKIGRKIVGRAGNKTVVCSIWPDEEMPYLTQEIKRDQYGVTHSVGERERVELITNPLAIINRTIPIALFEPSITFILDKTRKHMATLESMDEQKDFFFEIMSILNKQHAKDLKKLYSGLSDRDKREFIHSVINKGAYTRWESFSKEFVARDSILEVYEKYGDIITPYHIFTPKPKWGRDIYLGTEYVGYQYILLLKQSGERGFSVRSAGAISDESLPEKSYESKIGKLWHSETPIRFGEYETPNFMIITNPEDFALVSALYRSSIDGRRFMYEAILDDEGEYEIPAKFTSRSAEILQVYLKSLGVRMETIINEDEFIHEPGHDTDHIVYEFKNANILCTPSEMYYLKKLGKSYRRFIKKRKDSIIDTEIAWDYIVTNLPFKRKYLTDNIIKLFKENMQHFLK